MKALEVELDKSALRKQLEELQKQLELLDEEKKDTEERLQQEVKKCADLERRGKSLVSIGSPSSGLVDG